MSELSYSLRESFHSHHSMVPMRVLLVQPFGVVFVCQYHLVNSSCFSLVQSFEVAIFACGVLWQFLVSTALEARRGEIVAFVGDTLLRLFLAVLGFLPFTITDEKVIGQVVRWFNGVLLRGYSYQCIKYFVMRPWATCRIILSTIYSVLSVFGVSVRVRAACI